MAPISDHDMNTWLSVVEHQDRKVKKFVDRLIRAGQSLKPSPQKTKIVDEIISFSKAIVRETSIVEWYLIENAATISKLASENRILLNQNRLLQEQNEIQNDVFNVACRLLKINGNNL